MMWLRRGQKPEHHSFLSVVVIFYNMRREAARTLFSLSTQCQQNLTADDYEVIAIDNPGAVPFKQRRQLPTDILDDRTEAHSRVLHQRSADIALDPIEFVIHGGERDTQFLLHRAIRGTDRRLDPAHDQPHDIYDRGEEQPLRVLPIRVLLEQRIQRVGTKCVLQASTSHHGNGTLLDESVENSVEVHAKNRSTSTSTDPGRWPRKCPMSPRPIEITKMPGS